MSYNIDLSGRVALVTGASSGLGAQFARTLAKAGAGVALAGRRVERLKTLRAEIEAEGGDAHVVALVTGASSGLGEQFARVLARAGAGVALAGRRVERLKTLRAEIEAEGGDAHVVPLDVTDHDHVVFHRFARAVLRQDCFGCHWTSLGYTRRRFYGAP